MKNVSLVLSGGGARGVAHIGVIEELEKRGFNIHSIAGTSMGALVGGIYAAGKLSEFKKWLLNLDKIDVFKLMDFTLLNKGFIKGDKVFNELNEFIPDVKIQDLNINYQAIATDLTNRKEVVFTKGDLLKAIRASVSIPNILTPVKRGKSILVDGGVINNLPINHAIRKNKDILVAVNVNANIPLPENEKKKEKIEEKESFYKDLLKKFNNGLSKLFPNDKKIPLGYFDIMNDSLEIMRDELVKFSLEIYPPDILIETPRDMCRMFDFYKAKELIEVGQKATIKSLDDNKN
ncbi:MAG: phospholipase [Marinilabiliales bacterium]|mgnify:CR=1 FL=1|nr:MAG: phospholipase [Marinilabiliales bacterium]